MSKQSQRNCQGHRDRTVVRKDIFHLELFAKGLSWRTQPYQIGFPFMAPPYASHFQGRLPTSGTPYMEVFQFMEAKVEVPHMATIPETVDKCRRDEGQDVIHQESRPWPCWSLRKSIKGDHGDHVQTNLGRHPATVPNVRWPFHADFLLEEA